MDPVSQVNAMLDGLPANLFKLVWITTITNTTTPGCNWLSYTAEANCAYLKQIAAAVVNRA